MTLLEQMVRIAHANSKLRPHLLPLIKGAREVEKRYFHVSNSGLTVTVEDQGFGPELVVSTMAMGNLQGSIRTLVEPEVLFQLSKMFEEAFEHTGWSAPYVEAATPDDSYETSTDIKAKVASQD